MGVSEKKEKMFSCFRPGHEAHEDPKDNILPTCPKCRAVAAANLCQQCEKHKADCQFSQSTMDFIHGNVEKLCRCCTVSRWEEAIKKLQADVFLYKRSMEFEPCKEP